MQVLVNKENKGPNYCRNKGIKESKGAYILILDSDVELTNKYQIRNMIKIVCADKRIGELGGSFLEKDSRVRANNWDNTSYFDSNKNLLKKANTLLMNCDWIGTNNMFVKKKLLFELGGFDEFSVGGFEDAEFGLNLGQKGYLNLFSPEISVKHLHSKNERDNIGLKLGTHNANKSRTRVLMHYRLRMRYIIKNYSIIQDRKYFLNFFLKDFIKIFTEPISMLCFIKQQFFGLKNKKSQNLSSLKEKTMFLISKIQNYFFLYRLIVDSLLWNLIHFRQTIKSRNINFLEFHFNKN